MQLQASSETQFLKTPVKKWETLSLNTLLRQCFSRETEPNCIILFLLAGLFPRVGPQSVRQNSMYTPAPLGQMEEERCPKASTLYLPFSLSLHILMKKL